MNKIYDVIQNGGIQSVTIKFKTKFDQTVRIKVERNDRYKIFYNDKKTAKFIEAESKYPICTSTSASQIVDIDQLMKIIKKN